MNRNLIALIATLCVLLPASASAQKRGLISSAPCPYSCRSQGLNKSVCRDWKEGNRCYIEDLTRRPAASTANHSYRNPSYSHNHSHHDWHRGTPISAEQQCRSMRSRYIAPPRVYISQVKKSGNIFGDKYRINGSIEGVCLSEAGAFEEGRLKEGIRVETTPQFRRYEFSVRVDGDDAPEIRVYNVNGDRDEYRFSRRDVDRGAYLYR